MKTVKIPWNGGKKSEIGMKNFYIVEKCDNSLFFFVSRFKGNAGRKYLWKTLIFPLCLSLEKENRVTAVGSTRRNSGNFCTKVQFLLTWHDANVLSTWPRNILEGSDISDVQREVEQANLYLE